MDKRLLILLVICAFLGVSTFTIKYIEKEKGKIKERFFNLPKTEKAQVRRSPVSIAPPPEEPVVEETIPPQAEVEKKVPLPEGKNSRGESKMLPQRDIPKKKEKVPQEVKKDKGKEETLSTPKEVEAKKEEVPKEEKGAALVQEAPTPSAEGKEIGKEKVAGEGEGDETAIDEGKSATRAPGTEDKKQVTEEEEVGKKGDKGEAEEEEKPTSLEEDNGDREETGEVAEEEEGITEGEGVEEGEKIKETEREERESYKGKKEGGRKAGSDEKKVYRERGEEATGEKEEVGDEE
jgi:hypothetical protein